MSPDATAPAREYRLRLASTDPADETPSVDLRVRVDERLLPLLLPSVEHAVRTMVAAAGPAMLQIEPWPPGPVRIDCSSRSQVLTACGSDCIALMVYEPEGHVAGAVLTPAEADQVADGLTDRAATARAIAREAVG